MDGIKNKPSVTSQYLTLLLYMATYLVRSTERQYLLRVDPSSPESQPAAEFLFQPPGIHVFGINLNRIDNVESGFDQPGQNGNDSSARVLEYFPRWYADVSSRSSAIVWQPKFAEGIYGTKLRLL